MCVGRQPYPAIPLSVGAGGSCALDERRDLAGDVADRAALDDARHLAAALAQLALDLRPRPLDLALELVAGGVAAPLELAQVDAGASPLPSCRQRCAASESAYVGYWSSWCPGWPYASSPPPRGAKDISSNWLVEEV